MKCTFCQSEEILTTTPYIELKKDGSYGPIKRYCCNAQRANSRYARAHKNMEGEIMPDEEVEKW